MPGANTHCRDYIAGLDGSSIGDSAIDGGWINQHYVQFGYQLADSVAGFSYSFGMTCIILFLMNLVPGLSLRVSPEEEEMGLDDGQLGKLTFPFLLARRAPNALLTEGHHQASSPTTTSSCAASPPTACRPRSSAAPPARPSRARPRAAKRWRPMPSEHAKRVAPAAGNGSETHRTTGYQKRWPRWGAGGLFAGEGQQDCGRGALIW